MTLRYEPNDRTIRPAKSARRHVSERHLHIVQNCS
jgi:hypothetical protein